MSNSGLEFYFRSGPAAALCSVFRPHGVVTVPLTFVKIVVQKINITIAFNVKRPVRKYIFCYAFIHKLTLNVLYLLVSFDSDVNLSFVTFINDIILDAMERCGVLRYRRLRVNEPGPAEVLCSVCG